eukprot:747904-Hanusia_phi.AAC.2
MGGDGPERLLEAAVESSLPEGGDAAVEDERDEPLVVASSVTLKLHRRGAGATEGDDAGGG